jgi:hypothetical protein
MQDLQPTSALGVIPAGGRLFLLAGFDDMMRDPQLKRKEEQKR